ncbi:hypothetical protein GGR26_003039 [Lewinella marina]|uniref:Uncharacterized protein n=1 Tax=Neolewinella marina TaxID=438751 RepID=A0A2G0CEL0_9BACT|nr:hypothetical protein [Neolewinella marina]NJB87259.1 hypothetical protein [Neolewinella marina]PHK98416.1 hypothetical protein CGL56_12040 [Neolewinella marina]
MKFLYLFSFLLLLTSCGNAESEAADNAEERALAAAQEAAYSSMMDGHDRVMEMMGQITQAQRTITEQLTTGGHGDDYRELLLAANEQLEDADDAMMDWMNGHRPLDELRSNLKEDEIMNFIRERTRGIAEVEADIKTSLANAEQILSNEDHEHGEGMDHNH